MRTGEEGRGRGRVQQQLRDQTSSGKQKTVVQAGRVEEIKIGLSRSGLCGVPDRQRQAHDRAVTGHAGQEGMQGFDGCASRRFRNTKTMRRHAVPIVRDAPSTWTWTCRPVRTCRPYLFPKHGKKLHCTSKRSPTVIRWCPDSFLEIPTSTSGRRVVRFLQPEQLAMSPTQPQHRTDGERAYGSLAQTTVLRPLVRCDTFHHVVSSAQVASYLL
ncbi:hypothetical protein B0T25DRAFT_285667 [Lasiosphaeria hispida]|uniref:Uncharacterized protein n=1 Tax=Lasiosphaeria hispida TaxID=260671 RepID=A0AAJ0HBT6_9PEZI|nr:hypothetical protein B0T25DRAFT_285667 [Lasiosphaeria hispida]